eukprot:6209842-Pleurochrysis_carterae.AAC.4
MSHVLARRVRAQIGRVRRVQVKVEHDGVERLRTSFRASFRAEKRANLRLQPRPVQRAAGRAVTRPRHAPLIEPHSVPLARVALCVAGKPVRDAPRRGKRDDQPALRQPPLAQVAAGLGPDAVMIRQRVQAVHRLVAHVLDGAVGEEQHQVLLLAAQ